MVLENLLFEELNAININEINVAILEENLAIVGVGVGRGVCAGSCDGTK